MKDESAWIAIPLRPDQWRLIELALKWASPDIGPDASVGAVTRMAREFTKTVVDETRADILDGLRDAAEEAATE